MEIQGEVLTANYQNSHTVDNITMPASKSPGVGTDTELLLMSYRELALMVPVVAPGLCILHLL